MLVQGTHIWQADTVLTLVAYAYICIVSVGNLQRLFTPAVKHHGTHSTQVKNPTQHNLLCKVSFLF